MRFVYPVRCARKWQSLFQTEETTRLFNLLMTWENGGFDMLALELERGRFGEYTAEKLMKRFGPLKPAGIKKLKSFPTLFVYENLVGDARVGSLTEIRERNRHVLVEFQFDKQIAPFPAEKLKPILLRLDMGGSEPYRTHWAIRDEDLLQVLSRQVWSGQVWNRRLRRSLRRTSKSICPFPVRTATMLPKWQRS